MDIGNIRGNGPVDPTGDRSQHADRARAVPGEPADRRDSAAISSTGRETYQQVEALVEKARRDDGAGQERVERAKAALESGGLDRREVYEAAARHMLDRGF